MLTKNWYLFIFNRTHNPFTGEIIELDECRLPWKMLMGRDGLATREKFRELFLKYGAEINDEKKEINWKIAWVDPYLLCKGIRI